MSWFPLADKLVIWLHLQTRANNEAVLCLVLVARLFQKTSHKAQHILPLLVPIYYPTYQVIFDHTLSTDP